MIFLEKDDQQREQRSEDEEEAEECDDDFAAVVFAELMSIRVLFAEVPAGEAVTIEIDVEIRDDVAGLKVRRHAIAERPVGAIALNHGPRLFEFRRRRAGE